MFPISVAIVTYKRGELLVATVRQLQDSCLRAKEILVIDQTRVHPSEVRGQLDSWQRRGVIRWIRLSTPAIASSMNVALASATHEIVLFLDDDVVLDRDLIQFHAETHKESQTIWAVAGQVLQPGEEETSCLWWAPREGLKADLGFSFSSNERAWIRNAMAGNLSVKRERALAIGGFDENFVGVAYRFETEFCRRLIRAGGRVLFEPRASIRHLRATEGGTRVHGSHLCSASPAHGVGDYYFALREGRRVERMLYMLKRPFREVMTRFHLLHPWCIPLKLIGETRAFMQARRLARNGPRYGSFADSRQ